MQRQCAWFGCSAVASATYTFDSGTCTVWLDPPLDGGARAGDLCDRHARTLKPPRGWHVEDRRVESPRVESPRVESPRVESPQEPEPELEPETDSEAELRTMLDAHSPLLAAGVPEFGRGLSR